MKGKSFKKFLPFLSILIISTGIFIRFYKLGQIPNGLSVDEADIGYNTYSIIKTGKDVYGQNFPLFFQSLDDYKPGLVFYSSIPAIATFGLNDFSIRLAPAVFGSLTIILTYLIMRFLYPKNYYLAYVTTFLIAFAPWHIALSRAMIWYSQLIFFYALALLFLLTSFKKSSWLIIPAAFVLGLTVYIYYAAIIYLPLILVIMFFLYWRNFAKSFKLTTIAFLVLFTTTFPALVHYSSGDSRTRLNAISVLTPDVTLPTSITEIQSDKNTNLHLAEIIHNRRLVYFSAVLDNYFDYFNLDYLFITAKNTRYFYVNNVGLFYVVELPFFLYGMYLILRRRQKSDLLILLLLVIGPTPAAITLGSPFPHRALLTILSIQLISAIGIATFISNILRARREVDRKIKLTDFSVILSVAKDLKVSSLRQLADRTIIFVLFFAYGAGVYFFLHQYFVHSPHEFTSENDNGAWFSTVRDAITKVNQYKDNYDKVIFTWSQGKLVPAVYYLFYNQVDPKIVQSKSALWINEPPSYKQIYNQIDNIEFRSINWQQDKNLKNTLFIGYPSEFPQDIEVIDKTYLSNGQPHFIFVKARI